MTLLIKLVDEFSDFFIQDDKVVGINEEENKMRKWEKYFILIAWIFFIFIAFEGFSFAYSYVHNNMRASFYACN